MGDCVRTLRSVSTTINNPRISNIYEYLYYFHTQFVHIDEYTQKIAAISLWFFLLWFYQFLIPARVCQMEISDCLLWMRNDHSAVEQSNAGARGNKSCRENGYYIYIIHIFFFSCLCAIADEGEIASSAAITTCTLSGSIVSFNQAHEKK